MAHSEKTPAGVLDQLFNSACQFHAEGELQRAEHLYREILRQAPQHADALNMLGVVACQSGQPAAGADLLRRALALNPAHADYNNNLGQALLELRKPEAAIAAFEKALAARPRFAEAHFNLANAARVAGDLERAEKHYRKALKARADYADAINNLAQLLRTRGAWLEAAQLFGKLVRAQPERAHGFLNLGQSLHALARYDEALSAFQRAVALAPEEGAIWEAMGHSYRAQGALGEAVTAYGKALAHGLPNAQLLHALGLTQYAHNQVVEARASFAQALELNPADAHAHNHLGMCASALGEKDDAMRHFEQALALDPGCGAAWRNLAELNAGSAGPSDLGARINAALAGPVANTARVEMDFALARELDRCGDYDAAFSALARANRARRAQVRFDAQAQARFIDDLRAVFSPEYLNSQALPGNDSEVPVFIVGMPRSGTSLVEQIIASHARIHGAGELTFFPQLGASLPQRLGTSKAFPRCLPGREAGLHDTAAAYLELLRARGGTAARISDKMPYNFLYLGLIAQLFPRARIIHCRRHAMASCFSIYSHDLVGNHPYSYDLADLAAAWHGYARLMTHWRAHAPLAMLEVDYETLVSEPAVASRELIAFLGLDWDPACLDFHRNPRAVTSASQWQVRQPVYTTSGEHWRHYAQHLEPLRKALEKLGESVT